MIGAVPATPSLHLLLSGDKVGSQSWVCHSRWRIEKAFKRL